MFRQCMVVALLISSSAAMADAPESFDAGVGIGYTNYDVNKSKFVSLTPTASIDSTTYNLKLFGSFYFDEHLGITMDILTGGSVSATDQNVTTKLFNSNMFTVAAVLSFPVNDRVVLHGKLGGTSWQFSAPGYDAIDNGFGPSIGLGADINIYGGNERKLRIEWNHYQLDNVYVKSANDISINMVFFFGGD